MRHVRRRYRDILVARNIHTGRIIHLVVGAGGNRERRDIALAMVKNGGHIRREYALVIVSTFHRRVGPPQEMARRRVRVKNLGADFNQRAVRIQRETGHHLQPAHRLHLPQPDGLRPVIVLLDLAVHRHIGGRTVVLRPVELDPP
ncbi:hypothetical protein D3C76_1061940 [compost metagenome]